jgi:hypothetical protein
MAAPYEPWCDRCGMHGCICPPPPRWWKRFGYLRFGWGSCSGCDALEDAHGSLVDLTTLRDDLARSAHWEDDAYSLAYWLAHRDWGLAEWRDPATESFVVRSLVILAEHTDRQVPELPANR